MLCNFKSIVLMTTEKISVAFYRGGGANEPLMNRLTRWITGEFVHCEMVFVDDRSPKHNASCSVWAGENVFYKPKTFGREGWSYLSMNVPTDTAVAMRNWCKEQAAQDLPFNSWGFYRAITPFPRTTDGACWFCSELCTACMQQGGFVSKAIPGAMTPTHLWKLMSAMPVFVGASPVFRERIAQKGLKLKTNNSSSSGGGGGGSGSSVFEPDKMLTKKWEMPV